MIELTSNKLIGKQIEDMLNMGRSAHAFLFISGTKEERHELGMWLCEKILCHDEAAISKFEHSNHEDFLYVTKPEDRESILVSQMDELTEKLRFKPFGETYAVLIEDAHLMNQAAQNKLLKTLEEPTSQTVLVLLSEREESILPTVRSRCLSYHLETGIGSVDESFKDMVASFSRECLKNSAYYKKKDVIAPLLEDKDNARAKCMEFLDNLEIFLLQTIKTYPQYTEKLSAVIKQAEVSRRYLKQLHNVSYTMKQMCLRV